MPASVPHPQTSKQAKKAYQKSNKSFKFTASQERAAARRNAKDEYARKLREKEERSKNNKRKRDEKEEKEREAKRKLIEKGRLPEDALLPRVTASQPRLRHFVRRPPRSAPDCLLPIAPRDEDDKTVKGDSKKDEDALVNDQQPKAPAFEMDDNGLEEKPSNYLKQPQPLEDIEKQKQALYLADVDGKQRQQCDQNELALPLGWCFSEASLDFEICEDPASESEELPAIETSALKRKRDNGDFATPSKSTRSALSQMSPGKVLLRSQEKPDTTSAPSLSAKMLSPERSRPSSSQLARDMIAMISTQDISDDFDFSPEKENEDPLHEFKSTKAADTNDGKSNFSKQTIAGPSQGSSKLGSQDDFGSFDDTIFEDFMTVDQTVESDELKHLEDIEDFGDEDTCDADWAGLSMQMPRNTAVSAFGSPKKAVKLSAKSHSEAMAPPLRPSPVSNLLQKLKAATPEKVPAPTLIDKDASPTRQHYEHDDDIEVGLLALADIPSTSQSFGLDDGMDDDMLALVDEIDCASSNSSRKAKKGRTLPWTNRPNNLQAPMAEASVTEGLAV